MRWRAFIALTLTLAPVPASAGAGDFNVINATGLDIVTLEIRRFGTDQWKPLSTRPSAGAQGPVTFKDSDCAFDIRARLSGGVQAVWSGVNLCEVKSVTLNRNASGALWVDYD